MKSKLLFLSTYYWRMEGWTFSCPSEEPAGKSLGLPVNLIHLFM